MTDLAVFKNIQLLFLVLGRTLVPTYESDKKRMQIAAKHNRDVSSDPILFKKKQLKPSLEKFRYGIHSNLSSGT